MYSSVAFSFAENNPTAHKYIVTNLTRIGNPTFLDSIFFLTIGYYSPQPTNVHGLPEKLAMVTVCTQVLADNTGLHSSTRALAVTNLCFSDAP